ncbi:MAG: alpha/beta fold hydrolase [Sandaracinus sp.]
MRSHAAERTSDLVTIGAQHVRSLVELEVVGRPARALCAGDEAAPALVLVHGGWGGARMHWAPVLERLARHHRVIAPDLPGLGWVETAPLPSVAAYAAWLVALAHAMGVTRARWVGNSFGASVVASVAGRHHERVSGVAYVNGFPMPATPLLLRRLGQTRPARALMRAMVRRIYREASIARGFASPARIPASLREAMADWPLIVPRYADILVAGDGPPPPRTPPLLLFGAADHLPGTSRREAEHLAARTRGASLVLIEDAGHFPQLEQPEAFVDALERW